jgi:hypothetical protein
MQFINRFTQAWSIREPRGGTSQRKGLAVRVRLSVAGVRATRECPGCRIARERRIAAITPCRRSLDALDQPLDGHIALLNQAGSIDEWTERSALLLVRASDPSLKFQLL